MWIDKTKFAEMSIDYEISKNICIFTQQWTVKMHVLKGDIKKQRVYVYTYKYIYFFYICTFFLKENPLRMQTK